MNSRKFRKILCIILAALMLISLLAMVIPVRAYAVTQADIDAVKDEIADVMGYSLMMCDRLGLDPVEILEAKLKKNIAKYPVEKCKGRNTKYDKL